MHPPGFVVPARAPVRPALTAAVPRALRGSLHPDPATARRLVDRALQGRQPDQLVTAARYHRVSGFVLAAVQEDSRYAGLAGRLAPLVRDAEVRHLRACADLRAAGAALDAAGVGWLAFKGPVLVARYHPWPGLRPYADADVLVPASAFPAAVTALGDAGFADGTSNWTFLRDVLAGELTLHAPLGTPLDVHWTFPFRAELRREFAIDVDSAAARARVVPVADGLAVRTFDPVDTLVHLAFHAALDGGHRLVWLKDIERCVAVDAPGWAAVVERAREWRVGPAVGVLLGRSRRVLGTPVPAAVTRELLAAPGLRLAATLTDRLWPAPHASERGSPARLLARSARGDAAATWRQVRAGLTGLRPRNALLVLRPAAKPARAATLYEPGGGEPARAAYLRAVAERGPTA